MDGPGVEPTVMQRIDVMRFARTALIGVLTVSAPVGARADQASAATVPVSTVTAAASADGQRPSPTTAPAPARAAQPASAAKTHRWLDLQAGQLDARYRLIDTSAGVRTSNMLQHKQTLKAGLKFDPKGRYSLQAGFGTGNSFVGSWEATGLGTGDPTWSFALRTLYVAAQPVRGVDVQIGGLAATVRGESTEITAYDNDAFLIGERISVKRPKRLYLDEVSATAGYLGDVTTPNVFRRFDRWDEHNYTQLLAAKKLGARASTSADWTRVAGIDTWREAIRVGTKEAQVVDAVRLELYQRVDGVEGNGFAVTLEKAASKTVALLGGYATIDRNNGTLNGDRYARGRRLFVESRVNLTPELSVNVFFTRAVDNDFVVPNKTRFDAVVSYNVLKALQRGGLW
jgi:hypothetical protein